MTVFQRKDFKTLERSEVVKCDDLLGPIKAGMPNAWLRLHGYERDVLGPLQEMHTGLVSGFALLVVCLEAQVADG